MDKIPFDPVQKPIRQVHPMRKPLSTQKKAIKVKSESKTDPIKHFSDELQSRIDLFTSFRRKGGKNQQSLTKKLLNEQSCKIEERKILDVLRGEYEKEKQAHICLEKKINQLKTKQAEQLSVLRRKMCMLTLNTTTFRPNCSQTDHLYDNNSKIYEDKDAQTVEIYSPSMAGNVLRQTSDELLTAFITELQKAKSNAESDLKFSVASLEQRMKMDMDFELRRLEAEHERRIIEEESNHEEEMRRIKYEQAVEIQDLQGKIEFLQNELSSVRDTNEQLNRDLQDARDKITNQAKSHSTIQIQLEDTTNEMNKLKEYKETYQRDMRQVERFKKEATKYKDINQIIMGEFALLEKERDELMAQLEKGVKHMERLNGQRYLNLRNRTDEIERTLLGTLQKSLENDK